MMELANFFDFIGSIFNGAIYIDLTVNIDCGIEFDAMYRIHQGCKFVQIKQYRYTHTS